MNKKQKSLTNKGFSLVELIIVIAIMAVLIGVLAPQYVKYVAQSKISTDITNAEELVTAINVALSDPDQTVAITSGTAFASGADVVKEGSTTKVSAPASKVDSTYQWTVTYDDNGVSAVVLGTNTIWPDASDYKDNN